MRTIQILGKAYSESGSVNMTCTIDGVQQFNGPVPTVNSALPDQNLDHEVLFTVDVDENLVDQMIASDITVSNGTAYIVCIAANQLNPLDQGQFITLFRPAADLKNDVRLDGVLLDAIEPDDGWHYEVPDGSTLSIDWKIATPPQGNPGNPEVGITALVAGQEYKITSPATVVGTDWTTVGASSSAKNTIFTATGPAPAGTKGRATPTAIAS